MENNITNPFVLYKRTLKNLMKAFIFLLSTVVFSFNAEDLYSQNGFITISEDKEISVKEIFNVIKKQTDYGFVYETSYIEGAPLIKVKKGKIKIKKLLDKGLKGINCVYEFSDNTIIVKKQKEIVLNNVVQEEFTIIGKVVDKQGEPLVGVDVFTSNAEVKNSIDNTITLKGTSTDFDGNFTIKVGLNQFLNFNYLGYKPISTKITSKKQSYNFTLEVDNNVLEEVVVVGYGTSKKRDLTGVVGTVDIKDIEQNTESTLLNILGGKLSGVQVVQSNGGRPGGGASIQIRGHSSLLGSNEPLYIIDGVPFQPSTNGSTTRSPLTYINPNDIKSVNVLKDASAASIYGSRAANGVIIIETKRGKGSGKPSFNVNLVTGIHTPIFDVDLLNRDQFIQVIQESFENAGQTLPNDFDLGGDTDWADEILNPSEQIVLNISTSASTKDTNYFSSFEYRNEEGMVKPSVFRRYSGRFGGDFKVSNKFKLGGNLSYIYSERRNSEGTSAVLSRPDMPLDLKTFTDTAISTPSNQYYTSINSKSISATDLITASLYGESEVFNNVKVKSLISLSRLISRSDSFTPSFLKSTGINSGSLGENKTFTFEWSNTLTYNKSFKNNTKLNVILGASYNQSIVESLSIQFRDTPDDVVLTTLNSANEIRDYGSSKSISGLESYFSSFNYNMFDKYILSFAFRADQSTKFGPANRWGYFPSGGVAWDLSKESFISDNVSWIDFLKFKASYGITGLSSFANFLFEAQYQSGLFYDDINGTGPLGIANKDIRWERTEQFDIGFEFGLFNQALTGSLGYYSKYTSDLILNRDILPELGGGDTQLQNVGDISNRGIELELTTNIINKDKFKWDLGFNITYQKNTIEKLDGGFINSVFSQIEEGSAYGAFTGFIYDGIIQTQEEIDQLNASAPNGTYIFPSTGPGDRKYKDINGDGRISRSDQVIIGETFPDLYGGINTRFTYKKFQLSANFQYQIGAESVPNIVSENSHPLNITSAIRENLTTRTLNAWTPTNTDTDQPRNLAYDLSFNGADSDLLVQSTDYLRLKNVRLTYNIDVLKNINFDLFLSATNLFLITNFEGVDPEFLSPRAGGAGTVFGSGQVSTPYSRTISLGLNFKL